MVIKVTMPCSLQLHNVVSMDHIHGFPISHHVSFPRTEFLCLTGAHEKNTDEYGWDSNKESYSQERHVIWNAKMLSCIVCLSPTNVCWKRALHIFTVETSTRYLNKSTTNVLAWWRSLIFEVISINCSQCHRCKLEFNFTSLCAASNVTVKVRLDSGAAFWSR